jgi:hypothetical protein
MTGETLSENILKATQSLLDLAREVSWNKISDNCRYIVSEIKDSADNFMVQRRRIKAENRQKIPCTLSDIIPKLREKYDELYDINLHIDKAINGLTIIDIRYYSRLSLDTDYRAKVSMQAPMLHSKVTNPPYRVEGKRFDINWENENLRYKWNSFLLRAQIRFFGYQRR